MSRRPPSWLQVPSFSSFVREESSRIVKSLRLRYVDVAKGYEKEGEMGLSVCASRFDRNYVLSRLWFSSTRLPAKRASTT